MGRLLHPGVRRFLRAALKPAAALLLAGAAHAGAARRPGGAPLYDPEIALLALEVQKAAVPLLAEELQRQAEWLGLSGLKVLLDHALPRIAESVQASLKPESDVMEDFRASLLRRNTSDIGDIDRLVAEVRRYHGLVPGPPLSRLEPAAPGPDARLVAADGPGADVAAAVEGTALLMEPAAFADRRFGSIVALLRRRRWDVDFYFGDFADLLPHYRKLGFRVFYRLRAPYVSYGRQAYALSPEENLRPRLVYCAFYGRDYFRHVRAQFAVLAARDAKDAPVARTLRSARGAQLPGVKALRELASSVPYQARVAVMGYAYLFADALAERRLGTYQNEYWRLDYYSLPAGVAALLESRHTSFGEIAGSALEVLMEKGAERIFYAGPAAVIGGGVPDDGLLAPRRFIASDGAAFELDNILAAPGPGSGLHQSVASPLFVTREWAEAAAGRGVQTVDCEAAVVAQRVASFNEGLPRPVELGLAVLPTDLSELHPEEDRSVYTVDSRAEPGRESGKRRYRDAVLELLVPGR
ncbi:MAG: hypothetical protein PHF00_01095 [Elusimicrobia bacterium]|nr:hypothetical protein [Elusimicrobiota bacterium]